MTVEDLHSLLMDDPFTIFILNRTVRVNVSLVTGKEGKRLGLFPNKGGTTIFVLLASRGF